MAEPSESDLNVAILAAFRRLAPLHQAAEEVIAREGGGADVTVRAIPLPDGRTRLAATSADGALQLRGLGFPDGHVSVDDGTPAIKLTEGDKSGFQRVGLYLSAYSASALAGFLSVLVGYGIFWFSFVLCAWIGGLLYQLNTGQALITKRRRNEARYWIDIGYFIWVAALAIYLTYFMIELEKAW